FPQQCHREDAHQPDLCQDGRPRPRPGRQVRLPARHGDALAVTPRLGRGRISAGLGCPGGVVRVNVSAEAGEFVRERGGRLWVWAAHPRVCCWGTPAYMHAATVPPVELSGFSPAHVDGLEVWFRAAAGRMPDVLEIGVRGRRHPRVEAYWDGCSLAL